MNKNRIPIIYYHSVAPSKHPTWSKRYLTLELKFFEEHLKYFTRHGYKCMLLKEIFNLNPKDKIVCLTFDDGYLDNFIYVYPLLKKYKAKATIFINPVFVDKQNTIRKTLEDYWNNKANLRELNQWGFLSWDEMRLMEKSGLIDIQSHTLTHTKYFVSDKIIGLHHPGADCVYYVGNQFPERLPYYIEDQKFEKLLPYGYPIFEQKSSMIARRVTIRDSFIHSTIQSFNGYNWNERYNFDYLIKKIRPVYEEYKKQNSIIESIETEEEYKTRVYHELSESKRIIETELQKKVDICCWPSGDTNEFAHKVALDIGYKATTLGKCKVSAEDPTRIFRFGLGKSKNSLLLTRMKVHFKLMSFSQVNPFYSADKMYNKLRYGN